MPGLTNLRNARYNIDASRILVDGTGPAGETVVASTPNSDTALRRAIIEAGLVIADYQKPAADAADEARRANMANDAGAADLIGRLATATPAQIDNWLATNVTNVAQVRAVLAAVIKVLAARM